MEKGYSKRDAAIICCCTTILLLGAIAICTSLGAEFKRTKAKDAKLDGDLCSLPRSPAYALGIAASVCLSAAHILGTCVIGSSIYRWLFRKKDRKAKNRAIAPAALLLLSWIIFGLALVILVAATSMNKRQEYGQGWLDGECYVVKGGIYAGAAVLSIVAVIFLLSALFTVFSSEPVSCTEAE